MCIGLRNGCAMVVYWLRNGCHGLRNGCEMEAIGSGAVVIIDGRNIKHNNIADIEEEAPISVENMIVHIMEKGNCYNSKTRVFEAANVNVVA